MIYTTISDIISGQGRISSIDSRTNADEKTKNSTIYFVTETLIWRGEWGLNK